MGWGIELRKTNLGCRPCCLKGKAKSEQPSTRGWAEFHVVKEPSTPGNHMHENRETSVLAAMSSPAQEGEKPKLGMNGTEESESAPNPEYSTDEGAERGKAGPT